MWANSIISAIIRMAFFAILLALSISLKKIREKWFLILFSVLALLDLVGRALVEMLYYETSLLNDTQFFQIITIQSIMYNIALISLGMFIFSIWNTNRTKMTAKNVLFSFNDRIPRSTFWIVYGIIFTNNYLIGQNFQNTDKHGIIGWLLLLIYIIWLLISIWMSFALLTKRWHDLNRSGWMSLLMLIPIIGPLLVLGWCGFSKGDVGPNKYGEDPFYPEVNETASISDL